MCDRYEIAELLLARGADVNGVVYACGDSICAAEDEQMRALLRRHGARLTVETVSDPKVAQAILDGAVAAYTLGDAEPIKPADAPELLFGGSDPAFVRICLPRITRTRDDPWWNDRLRVATSTEALRLILEHGVDPDVPDGGECTTLHHFASGCWKWSENLLVRATMLLDAGASLSIRDALLKSTPLGWACRWGQIELVKLFLERGADPVEANAEPWATPLAWATKRGHHEIVQLLRSSGVGT
jgi:ankyrin repeat protein